MAREMKDSGIEWIGEIPKEWEIGKVKRYYKLQTGFTPDTKNELYYSENEEGFDWLTIGDLNGGKIIPNKTKSRITQKYIDDYKPEIIPKNSLLYSFKLSVGQVAFTDRNIYSNEAIACFIPKENINLRFLYYSSLFIKENSNENIYGAKLLNQELIKNAFIIFPPLEEQEKIANYLDKKISDIDLIIEKTKATIEDYKKYKQSIITEAVTKGLNPNVEMKDSGIEWIGQIPKHWEVAKLKQVSYIRARLGWKGLKAEEYTEEGYMFLSAFNIINSKLNFLETNFINSYRYEESPEIKLKIDDVLIVKDGAGIGKCACVEYLPQEATINGSIALISTYEEIKGKFLYYYFLTKVMQKYVDRLKDGMGVPHLFQRDIKEIRISFSNIEEQQQIVEYLDKKVSEIDNLIVKKESLINEMEEYKKSLIYECVTGKKEIV